MGAPKGWMRERCQLLAVTELVEPIHSEMYELTKWRWLFLEGEIDARYQPRQRVGNAL